MTRSFRACTQNNREQEKEEVTALIGLFLQKNKYIYIYISMKINAKIAFHIRIYIFRRESHLLPREISLSELIKTKASTVSYILPCYTVGSRWILEQVARSGHSASFHGDIKAQLDMVLLGAVGGLDDLQRPLPAWSSVNPVFPQVAVERVVSASLGPGKFRFSSMLGTKLHVQLFPACSSHCSFKGYRLQ